MYDKIKKWYIQGLWTEEMVKKAADKGVITQKQAAGILGQEE